MECVISFCLGCDDKNLGASFEWGGAWVKMPRINGFSRNMNSIKFSHTGWNIKVWEKIQQAFWGEIKPDVVYRHMKGGIIEANLRDKDGDQDCLPFCWF